MSGKNEEDLGKFAAADDDGIKPIDIGGKPAAGARQLPGDQALSGTFLLAPEEQAEDDARLDRIKKEEGLSEAQRSAIADQQVLIKSGEYVDLLEKDPTLKRIIVGAGWDTRSFEGDPVDIDLSIFMLDKKNMTRVDEDFIFYNNERAFDGAVYHMGDSRSGAGDGDDESIFIDLNGLSFEILKIVCCLSIYDPEFKGHHFGMVKNVYLRILNKDDGEQIFRYRLDEEQHKGGNAIIVGTLIREGPRWIYEASMQLLNGGLAKVATDYGIIVKELQSTGEDVALPEDEL